MRSFPSIQLRGVWILMVLVASYDKILRQQAVDLLQASGHEVVSTDRSSDLIRKLIAEPYDLVVIDADLAGMDGVEVLPVLRRVRPTVPIVLITGEVTVAIDRKIAREGVFYHFRKPLYDEDFVKVAAAAMVQASDS
ncbi:MAG: response regulator [bacterium]|nr:response regulator [bacterium]